MDQVPSTSSPVDPSPFTYVVGIDIGSQSCSFCTLKPDKSQVIKPTDFANAPAGFALLLDKLERLGVAPEQILIGLEATSRYGENLYVRPDVACVEWSASSRPSVQGCLQSLSASLVTVG
jgi:Transposase